MLAHDGVNRLAHSNPLKRLGKADEVANIALFLCSEGASFVNGEIGQSCFIGAIPCIVDFSLNAVVMDGGMTVY